MRHFLRNAALVTSGVLVLSIAPQTFAGVDPESNTDGFDPAAETFRINEARRMNEISRQLELNYRMIYENGFNPASPPIRQPHGYESKQVAPNKWMYRPLYPEAVEIEPEVDSGPELLPAPGPPLKTKPASQPLPPQAGAPQAPGPADAQPGDRIVPRQPAARPLIRGPREF